MNFEHLQQNPTSRIKPNETLANQTTAEKKDGPKPLGLKIFDNIYEQLSQPSSLVSRKKQGERFLATLTDGRQKHILTIEDQNLTNQQIFQDLWQKMTNYLAQYQNSSRFEAKTKAVSAHYKKLIKHVSKLVQSGEVKPLTAKVFLRSLPNFKYIGDYNTIIKNNEEIPIDELKAKNTEFASFVSEMFEKHPENRKLEETAFFHFNPHFEGKVKTRIYISAKLSGSPKKVLQAWQSALQEAGLQDEIYFKIPFGLGTRFETIIIYQTEKTKDEDLLRLLTTFKRLCPNSLLNEKDMPTGVPLSKGVCTAPEPANINTVIKYIGSENKLSYNSLIASLTQLSFELAYNEAQKNGEQNITPKKLKAKSGEYFIQMLKLAGINAETMVPFSQGGKLPAWAEKLKK